MNLKVDIIIYLYRHPQTFSSATSLAWPLPTSCSASSTLQRPRLLPRDWLWQIDLSHDISLWYFRPTEHFNFKVDTFNWQFVGPWVSVSDDDSSIYLHTSCYSYLLHTINLHILLMTVLIRSMMTHIIFTDTNIWDVLPPHLEDVLPPHLEGIS